MSFFDGNMKVLEKYKYNLYNAIKGYDQSISKEKINSVRSVETKDGNLSIVLEKGEDIFRLNSAYKPLVEAGKWASQFEYQNLDIVVSMFGFGNGIFPREIMKLLNKEDVLIVLEPSMSIFMHVMEMYDITDLIKEDRLAICIEEINPNEFARLVSECITWINIDSQIKCAHPQYEAIFSEKYEEFQKSLQDAEIRAIVNKNTEAYWGATMVVNEISNLKYLKECNILSDYIHDIPKDIPAIIVSAGPSLDKNISELKRAKGKSVIFSTDTGLKYLLTHNIIPDFVVTLDAKKSLIHFTNQSFSTIPLLCKFTSNPAMMEMHIGKKIFFKNEEFVDNILSSLGKQQIDYNPGGSVSTAAFSICVGLGFERIITIGQDLSFNGEKTHAGGLIYNAHGSAGGATMMVEDIYGNMVKTRFDWYTYILWFQDAIAVCPHIDVIDATEGGAKIKGSRILTLEETINMYCKKNINIEQIVKEKKPTLEDKEIIVVKDYFKQSLIDLNQIKDYSKELMDMCSKLIIAVKKDNMDSYVNQAIIKKISKYNKELVDISVYQLLNDYISRITTKELGTINQFTDDVKNNQIKTFTKSGEIYKAIYEAVDVVKPLIEKSIEEF